MSSDTIGTQPMGNAMWLLMDAIDKHPEEMVIEAVKLAKDLVTDWKQYDWDDDDEVDQVMIIYAGNDIRQLSRGIYIVNGKKIVK